MKKFWLGGSLLGAALVALFWFRAPIGIQAATESGKDILPAVSADGRYAHATFAGGCFWCVEADFEQVPGVIEAVSGYTGGVLENPSYEEVAAGITRHIESVQVRFDPNIISYEGLLQAFWRIIDPTDPRGQFYDRGMQYSTVIFYHDDEQKRIAEKSRAELNASGRYARPVITPIREADTFYRAEDHHQDYSQKNGFRYRFYRFMSGRDRYLARVWQDDLEVDYSRYSSVEPGTYEKLPETRLRVALTPLQYDVTQRDATEPPFRNEYWNEKRDGIYVDIVSGEPLFSSADKYDSGTGWPSFTRPIVGASIVERTDYKLLLPRIEVRSGVADSHLGHVFDDGPGPTGLRYCINSASMRFVPRESLEAEGYGQYSKLFDD